MNSISNYVPSFMPSPESLSRTLRKSSTQLAVATVAMLALSSLPGADGGPLTYSACILGCTFASAGAMPFCLAACAIALGLPVAP